MSARGAHAVADGSAGAAHLLEQEVAVELHARKVEGTLPHGAYGIVRHGAVAVEVPEPFTELAVREPSVLAVHHVGQPEAKGVLEERAPKR